MKNKQNWRPTKYVYKGSLLRASRNTEHVNPASRLIADLVAKFYDTNLKIYAKGTLLDLGCGYVPFYDAYKKLIDDNICIDWENSLHSNSFLDLVADLNQSLPLEENRVDTILLSDVLEHISDPNSLWREMHRVLKKEGYLLLNVPFFYWLHEEPFDFYRYTKFALQTSAEKNGFKIIKLDAIGGLPEVLTDLIAKTLVKIPFIGMGCSIAIQKITWYFIQSSYGKRLSRKSGAKFPLGYVLIAKK